MAKGQIAGKISVSEGVTAVDLYAATQAVRLSTDEFSALGLMRPKRAATSAAELREYHAWNSQICFE